MKKVYLKSLCFSLLSLVCISSVLFHSIAHADILIDDDNSAGQQLTVNAPGDHTQTADLTDGVNSAVLINNTNGVNGTFTINSGVTISSQRTAGNPDALHVSAGATLTGLTVQGTLEANAASLNAIDIENTSSITTLINTGTIKAANGAAAAIWGRVGSTIGTFLNTGTIEHTGASSTVNIQATTTFTNDTGGTIRSAGWDAVKFGSGGNVTIDTFTNNGTISAGRHALLVTADTEITTFSNTGTITSTGAAGAGFYLQEDQDAAITNAGTIQNTAGGYALWLDTEAQTKDFTNSGTLSSATGTAINADSAMTGATDGFVNTGTITGGGTAIDAEAAFKLKNSGTITGAIDHATAGALSITNSGTITGNITSTFNAAHSLTMSGGTITGDITLNGTTANAFTMTDGTIAGTIDLGDNAAHTVTLTKGTITSLDMGDTQGGTATVNAAAGTKFIASNSGGTAITGEGATVHMTGAGIFKIIGNVVDTGGQANHILDIDSGTLQFLENSTIDGGIDADGSTIKVGTNTVTVKAATDIAADATLGVTVGTSTGQLTDGTSNTTITLQDGSTIDVTIGSGVSDGATYTVVDATGGALTATAANLNLTGNTARYNFALAKNGETLVIQADKSSGVVTKGSGSGVDENVDTAFASDPEMFNAINGITSSTELTNAYETMEPETTPAVASGSINFMNDALATVENRITAWSKGQAYQGIAAGDKPIKKGIWLKAFGSVSEQDDKDEFNGFDADSVGLSGGADLEITELLGDKMLLGLAYSYGITDIDTKNSGNEVDIKSNQITAYGSIEFGKHFVHSTLSYGLNDYDGTRKIIAGSVRRTASSDYDGYQWNASGEYGYKFNFNKNTIIKPSVGLQYTSLNVDSYTETGAGSTNLMVKSDDYSILCGKIGLSLSTEKIWKGYNFIFNGSTHYSYDFNNDPIEAVSAFSGGGNYFKTTGMEPGHHSGTVGAGMKVARGEGIELSINYDATLKDKFISHNQSISLRYDF